MKTWNRILTLAAVALALVATPARVEAQQDRPNRGDRQGGPPNFDPEQMRQRMMERYREQLEVKGDAEWKILEARITKVSEARREAGSGMMGRGMFGGGRGGPGGGAPGGGNDQADAQRQNRRNPFAAAQLPEAEELQKALDGKASADELKAKLAKLRDARKAKQAALTKAQDDLRAVLTVRQEATAVMLGLLE